MSDLYRIPDCENATRTADVLFLHGLGGDAFKTWRHGKDDSTSWPHWLGAEFSTVGVWSLGYAASPTKWMRLVGWLFSWFSSRWRDAGHSMSLPDRAGQVLDLMVQHGFGQRPILLIGHSLGGLLAKEILRTSKDAIGSPKERIFQQTRAVLFLATPHDGASLASMANAFRKISRGTVSMDDLRAHDPHLRNLKDWYRNHANNAGIETATYYETRDVCGVRIVNESSMSPEIGRNPIGLDEDHLSIAKPRKPDAQVCAAVRELLRNYVLAARPTPSQPNVLAQVITPPPPTEVVVRLDLTSVTRQDGTRLPRQLPPPAVATFVGRRAQLEKLTARLKAGQNTAVSGDAGYGKTALAAEAVMAVVGRTADSLAVSPFPDGVVFLDLYAYHGEAEPVWHSLANTLAGVAFHPTSPARVRASEACRQRRLLVIIEGGEEADGRDGHAQLRNLLGVLSPENRWLLLTRDGTQALPAETVRLRDSLAPDEAAALFDALTEGRVAGPVRHRVLTLLEGHPLALTWAGSLLARDDEEPARLVDDWESQPMLRLSDPTRAEHTLKWLFGRSIRGLDETARQTLAAAGLLARASFPVAAMEHVFSVLPPSQQPGRGMAGHAGNVPHVREALKQLINRGLLRRTGEDEQREFTHVLGYRFARNESASDAGLRNGLAGWLHRRLSESLAVGANPTDRLADLLQHAAALLRADHDQQLWLPLAIFLLYEGRDRLVSLGRLDWVNAALGAVNDWLDRFPAGKSAESKWQRERAVCFNRLGDLATAQGDLPEAQRLFGEAHRITQRLAASDPANAEWQRDRSVLFNKLGELATAQGNLSEAQRL
ncbi:MAG: NACHT domain-containing protein, partial [Planctomycetota bacterium]|nr:NACHT domain-containing protein [Planctomycetota bacterium]